MRKTASQPRTFSRHSNDKHFRSIKRTTASPTLLSRSFSEINMVAQTAAFKKAVEDSRKLKAKPTDDELLQVCQ